MASATLHPAGLLTRCLLLTAFLLQVLLTRALAKILDCFRSASTQADFMAAR